MLRSENGRFEFLRRRTSHGSREAWTQGHFLRCRLGAGSLTGHSPIGNSGCGTQVALKDPVVVYGALAMVFGYYVSRFINESERATAFLSLQVKPRRIRANIRTMQRTHRSTKDGRETPQTPRQLKLSVQRLLLFTDVILIPYRLTAGLFVAAAVVFMFIDLVGLAQYIWASSPLISSIIRFVTEP
jgi:hypothetical protein